MAHDNFDRFFEPAINMRAGELLGFLARAKDDGAHHPLDAQEAIDAMIVALGTILEAVPEYETRRDFRKAAETIGSEILTFAWSCRQSFGQDGKHHLERLGGIVTGESKLSN